MELELVRVYGDWNNCVGLFYGVTVMIDSCLCWARGDRTPENKGS